MANERALDLIKRLATDGDFRNQLNALDAAGKQALLEQNGFGGVSADEVRGAAAEAFGSLSGQKGGIDASVTVESIATAASVAAVATPAAAMPATANPAAAMPAAAMPATANPAAAMPAAAMPATANPAAAMPAAAMPATAN
ncbi:hypothetical protein MCW82_31035, partial [Azospirillum doebereinerae]|uniref:hypothetical protein n=1 Tax=Azospirillum doebereinerae TaxID=92933 RepID=UPI001EE583B1